MHEVSTFRLYLLRATYLLIFVGQGMIQWPRMIHHLSEHGIWSFWNGVGTSMLLAMSILMILGLRYPLKMLPLLFFETGWKSIWLLAVALPLWLAHRVDADTWSNIIACVPIWVIFPVVVPWRYVLEHFARTPGDRWRSV